MHIYDVVVFSIHNVVLSILFLVINRSSQFWIPALANACSIGIYNVWDTQFDTIFQHLVDVGQVGVYL